MVIRNDLALFFPPKQRVITAPHSIEATYSLMEQAITRHAPFNEFVMSFKRTEDGFQLSQGPTFFNARYNVSVIGLATLKPLNNDNTEVVLIYKVDGYRVKAMRIFSILFIAITIFGTINQSNSSSILEKILLTLAVVCFLSIANLFISVKASNQAFILHCEIVKILNATTPSSAHN